MIPPALLPGLPPFGRGGYARDVLESYLGSFVALNAWRSDVAAQARQARSRGLRVYLYGTPERWRPDTWRPSLARIIAQCRSLGLDGIIADAEGNWSGQVEEARALGRALAQASDAVNVGFTSFPSWPYVRELAAQCRGKVWGTPQIYGRTGTGEGTFAAWYAPWVAAFGPGRVLPSIAGWVSNDRLSTSAGFRAYLEMLPAACGCIVWDEAGSAPAHIVTALSSYTPKAMVPKAIEALMVQPLVIAILAAVALSIIATKVKV